MAEAAKEHRANPQAGHTPAVGDLGHVEEPVHPVEALPQMPAHPEVPPQRSRQTEDAFGIGPCSAGPHRHSQIVEIAVETSHPCGLLGAMHSRFGLLGDREVIRAVSAAARF